jgi:hypothetical protein
MKMINNPLVTVKNMRAMMKAVVEINVKKNLEE